MKAILLLLGVIPLLASCASEPIALAPVGPPPVARERLALKPGQGQLQVYTQPDERALDKDVPYFPHRDYYIYTTDGTRLKRVWNSHTYEDETPTMVTLPAGDYVVEGDAVYYGTVRVPVVIRPGRTTRVILQPGWKPKAVASAEDLVRTPGPRGYPVGWRADLVAGK